MGFISAAGIGTLRFHCAQLLDALDEIRRRLTAVGGRHVFEIDDERLALGELAGHRDLVPVVVPLEEAVRRGAEAVPHDVGLVAAHGANRLPLGLQPLELGGGRVPVGRLGQHLGALAERFLLGEVVRPRLLAAGQVFAAAREERVARDAEPVRQLAAVVARDRPERLPLGLKRLEPSGGLAPFVRLRERFGFLDDRELLLEVPRALFAEPVEVRLAPAADEIGGRAEAIHSRCAEWRGASAASCHLVWSSRSARAVAARSDVLPASSSLFSEATMASAIAMSCSWRCALAKRRQSSISRSSRTRGATFSCSARSLLAASSMSRVESTRLISSRPALMSRIRRSPSRSVTLSASDARRARSASRCR
jgi:hypothetical protein